MYLMCTIARREVKRPGLGTITLQYMENAVITPLAISTSLATYGSVKISHLWIYDFVVVVDTYYIGVHATSDRYSLFVTTLRSHHPHNLYCNLEVLFFFEG
jgi:hypothetical protein